MWRHDLDLVLVLAGFEQLLLLQLLLFEAERDDRRQLQRVANRDQLAAVESGNGEQALGFEHLGALVEDDDLELHVFHAFKPCRCARRSDHTLRFQGFQSRLKAFVVNLVDAALNGLCFLELRLGHLTSRPALGLNLLEHAAQLLDGVLVGFLFVRGRSVRER